MEVTLTFNFNGITHISENPKGHAEGYNFSFVGSVPLACLEPCKPTRADVMGGRVQKDGLAYHGRKMATVDEAVQIAKAAGAKLCTAPGCACRNLFQGD